MANYQIAFHLATKHAVIQLAGDALPANVGGTQYRNVGTFEHANVENGINDLEFDVNHVFFQHVRDALYKVNSHTGIRNNSTLQFPENITDMAGLTISLDEIVNNISIDVTPATATLTVAAPTRQLATAFTPANSSDKRLTYVSSDPTKATVSATGLVTRVANGTTTITITTVEGGKTDTVAITVTA